MVNCEGHTIELISFLKSLGLELWVHTNYQPTLFNIRGPCCRLEYFYWTENSVHWKGFQFRGRRWVHGDMTSVSRVAHLLSCTMVYDVGHTIKAPYCKSHCLLFIMIKRRWWASVLPISPFVWHICDGLLFARMANVLNSSIEVNVGFLVSWNCSLLYAKNTLL